VKLTRLPSPSLGRQVIDEQVYAAFYKLTEPDMQIRSYVEDNVR
jgi:hypothetical protein